MIIEEEKYFYPFLAGLWDADGTVGIIGMKKREKPALKSI